jgi:hypothetical protein
VTPLKTGKSRCLARLYPAPAEERLIRLVPPRKDILQDLAMDRRVFWQGGAQVFQVRRLLVARRADAALLPEDDALFEGRVVARAATPQRLIQRARLGACWLERVLVSFVETRVAHMAVFPASVRKAEGGGTFGSSHDA